MGELTWCPLARVPWSTPLPLPARRRPLSAVPPRPRPPPQLATVKEVVAVAAARDKFWRGVQYGAKGVFGAIAVLIEQAHAAGDQGRLEVLEVLHTKWKKLATHVSGSRRTFRFFASAGLMVAVRRALVARGPGVPPACPWGTQWTLPYAASKSLMIAWHLLDNVRFFQQIGWVTAGKPPSHLHPHPPRPHTMTHTHLPLLVLVPAFASSALLPAEPAGSTAGLPAAHP